MRIKLRHSPCAGSASYYSFWQTRLLRPLPSHSCARLPPGSPPACLDRRRTLPLQLRGAAELKFVPSKCRPHPVYFFYRSLPSAHDRHKVEQRQDCQSRRRPTWCSSRKACSRRGHGKSTRERSARRCASSLGGCWKETLGGMIPCGWEDGALGFHVNRYWYCADIILGKTLYFFRSKTVNLYDIPVLRSECQAEKST